MDLIIINLGWSVMRQKKKRSNGPQVAVKTSEQDSVYTVEEKGIKIKKLKIQKNIRAR